MGSTILLVEDNAANLKLMEFLLQAFGHSTISARDGAEGVALASEWQPDVILMDLQLPTMDGFEAARRIKANPALERIPIVAVTASAIVGERNRILASGFDGYIAKPITTAMFVSQIEAYLPGPAGTP